MHIAGTSRKKLYLCTVNAHHNVDIDTLIAQQLERLQTITLSEMKEIRLMNRTDTKFVTNKEKLAQLLELCQGQYYAQINGGSKIASYITTYWDTDNHHFFMEHHNGRAPRQKVRVRTYMDSLDSFLEVKTKNNHGRTKKKRIQVSSQETAMEGEANDFLMGLIHRTTTDIHPTVQNRFRRITLVNYGKTERLTIDFDVKFHNFETDEDNNVGNLVVVELKRDGNVFSPVLALLRQLRIKPCGFSKYCIGTVMTNRGIKQNNFKEKMINYRKISKAQ